jgi:hypothetical protein
MMDGSVVPGGHSLRLLAPDDAEKAWSIVTSISSECENWRRWKSSTLTVANWWGGALLHLLHHQQVESAASRAKAVSDLLDLAFESAGSMRLLGLYSGLAGLGWGIQYASTLLGDESELGDLDDVLNVAVERQMITDCELIGGLAGVGMYGVARARGGHCNNLVEGVVLALERTARQQIEGVAWFKAPEFVSRWQRELIPHGCYNFGLSHGNAGASTFLCRALELNVCADIAADLIERNMQWLIGQYTKKGAQWKVSSMDQERRSADKARLAWCYNELGTTIAVLDAALVMGRKDWLSFCTEVLHGLTPIGLKDSGVYVVDDVVDPALCHGIAGVAHLFVHSGRRLEDEVLTGAGKRWLQELIRARCDTYGIAGFPRIGSHDDVTRRRTIENDLGFLEGAAGVGLVLLAALEDEEPGWNRLLGF